MPLLSRPRRLALATSLSLALGALIGGPVATVGAATPPCKVTNITRSTTFGAFQTAVIKAKAGDTLQLRGTCAGPITIGKNLTVVGVKTKATGAPTLTGKDATRVLRIRFGATVTLKTLVIRDGRAEDSPFYPDSSGAGILLEGKATLVSVTIRDNLSPNSSAGSGAIEAVDDLDPAPVLIITGASKVFGNEGGYGGAIEAYGPVTIKGTTRFHHNHARIEGGALAVYGAQLLIKGSARIDHNTSGIGGGIKADNVRLGEHAVVDFNEADSWGGGIDAGSLTIGGQAQVRNNTAGDGGGGVFGSVSPSGACDASIHDNTPDNCAK